MHPLSTHAWSTVNAPKSFDKDPTLESNNQPEEAITTTATAHMHRRGGRTHGHHLHYYTATDGKK
jgi:hypothetical protein